MKYTSLWKPIKEGARGGGPQIPFLKELGVNCVELLPVFEYDELEFQRTRNPRDHMVNIWGYSHLSFFAPNSRFAAGGGGPAAARREFKDLVKAFHAAGIKVILDVVYNHTVEGGLPPPPQAPGLTLSALAVGMSALWQYRTLGEGPVRFCDQRGEILQHRPLMHVHPAACACAPRGGWIVWLRLA